MRQNLVSPFTVLQDKLGDDYDVRIYTSAYAKAIPSHENYVFKCIPEQLEAMRCAGLALAAVNDNGLVTVLAFGGKPEEDMTLQATVTEVQR